MVYAREFKQKARKALQGHWGIAVLVGFLASLLGGANGGSGGSSAGGSSGSSSADWTLMDLDGIIPTQYQIPLLALMSAITFIVLVLSLVHFVIGGAVELGYARFNLNLLDNQTGTVADLFSEFKRFGTAFSLRLLRSLYIIFWSLLFIIPGILASYSYAMSPFILLEHPEMTANEAIAASKKMMYGNRWKLFCLEFSFIGWSFLCMFTLGIGYLWLLPYMETSRAAFYRNLTEKEIYD